MFLKLIFLTFIFLPIVSSVSSSLHLLSYYSNNTVPTKIYAEDGSRIYLSSLDKAAHLYRITLTSKGESITLDKLLVNVDANGFKVGWPVSSDLTISTTNSANITHNLKGSLFIATPQMVKDPNFLVYVVGRNSTATLDRSTSADTTIVFLSQHAQNSGNPTYQGFYHSRVMNIVQPTTTSLSFYRYLPNDDYVNVNNPNVTMRRIFSNPLKIGAAETDLHFFNSIDPIQFSLNVWYMRAVGTGIKLDVSGYYVDTTTIDAGQVTTTGVAISQLVTYDSSINFMAIDNNHMAKCGYVLSSELFLNNNLTLTMNGRDGMMQGETIIVEHVDNHLIAVDWPVLNIQAHPNALFTGEYFIQYFAIDKGLIPPVVKTTLAPTTPSTLPSTVPSSVAPNVASTSSVNPSSLQPSTSTLASTTMNVQTTTKSSSTLTATISGIVVLFMCTL